MDTPNLEDRLGVVYNLVGDYAYTQFVGDESPPTPANAYSAVRVNPAEYYYAGNLNGLYVFKRFEDKRKTMVNVCGDKQ